MFGGLSSQVTCFAEAGGQHVSEMARAVELLGLRACLVQSTMDSGEGLPELWATRTTDDCIQVEHHMFFIFVFFYLLLKIMISMWISRMIESHI